MRGFVVTVLLSFSTGCAHYTLPASRLETPEVRGGEPAIGRLELGALSAADLTSAPSYSSPDPTNPGPPIPRAQKAFLPFFGFLRSMNEKLDVGVRFAPMAPLSFRLKYQLSGEPESRAAKGNIPVSLLVSPGFLLGGDSGKTVTYFSGEISLLVGYRLGEHHLVSASPFFSFGSLSGISQGTDPALQPGGSESVSQYGAGIFYQFADQALILRAEVTYLAGGSIGTVTIGGLGVAGAVGLSI